MPSSFAKDVLKLTGGTVVAQAIALGFLPILTRIYSPEDFGILTLYIAISGILVVFATLRFEAAIMLPASDRHAADLVALVVLVVDRGGKILLRFSAIPSSSSCS